MKTYYVDIDDTICITKGIDYSTAKPIKKNIAKINSLYDKGNIIVYWTARGTLTKIDWEELTKKQLSDWGAKHHELKLNKPAFDFFIDDKAISSNVFFKNF
tara:strand:+ start:125 stop:427 length:303 start_codon:yes stop_codon:yes gene_type:complete